MIKQKSGISRSEARRQQIHIAAAKCFRQYGFHGTSMAQISNAANMSVGHIYHYFKNKEEIIAHIVAKDTQHLLTTTSKLLSAHNIKATILNHVIGAAKKNLDPNVAALQLEIVAEAARNPTVAKIIQTADKLMRNNLAKIIGLIRQADGHKDSKADILGMVETIAAMFEGLRTRAVCNPKLKQRALIKIFKQVSCDLLK